MASSQKRKIVFGLVAGGLVGGFVTGLVGGVVAYATLKSAEAREHRMWRLVPVVVATNALAPGARMSLDALSVRSVPEMLVTSSWVKPDAAAYVKDQLLTVPLSAGDPLHWAFFSATRPEPKMESPRDHKIWDACDAALDAPPTARQRHRTAAAIRASLSPLTSEAGQ